jgi:hypothetical protein
MIDCGEIVYNGEVFVARPTASCCNGCAFLPMEYDQACKMVACHRTERDSGKSVIFVRKYESLDQKIQSDYAKWRITYQSSEQAARAAYEQFIASERENNALRDQIDRLTTNPTQSSRKTEIKTRDPI